MAGPAKAGPAPSKPAEIKGGGAPKASAGREGGAWVCSSNNKAVQAPAREHHPSATNKRKALQHGRPQLAAVAKAKSQGAVAAVEPPPPHRDEPVGYGRVSAVPGLSLAQPPAHQPRARAAWPDAPADEPGPVDVAAGAYLRHLG